MGDDIADAAQLGTDVILTCLGQTPLSTLVAAAFGVPSMGVYVAPSVPTAEFPMPGSAPAAGEDAPDNRAAGRQLLDRGRAIYADVLPRLGQRLGLLRAQSRPRRTTGSARRDGPSASATVRRLFRVPWTGRATSSDSGP